MYYSINEAVVYQLRKTINVNDVVEQVSRVVKANIALNAGRSTKAIEDAFGPDFDAQLSKYLLDGIAVSARLSALMALKSSTEYVAHSIVGRISAIDNEIIRLGDIASRYHYPKPVADLFGELISPIIFENGSIIVQSISDSTVINDAFSINGDAVNGAYDGDLFYAAQLFAPRYFNEYWFVKLQSMYSDIIPIKTLGADHSSVVRAVDPGLVNYYSNNDDAVYQSGSWYLTNLIDIHMIDATFQTKELEAGFFMPNRVYDGREIQLLYPKEEEVVMNMAWWFKSFNQVNHGRSR